MLCGGIIQEVFWYKYLRGENDEGFANHSNFQGNLQLFSEFGAALPNLNRHGPFFVAFNIVQFSATKSVGNYHFFFLISIRILFGNAASYLECLVP